MNYPVSYYSNIILDRYRKGYAKEAIAKELNLKYSQIRYFYRKNRLRQKFFQLNDMDKQFIARHKHNLTNKEIAKVLNRPENTISRYRKSNHYLSAKEKQFISDNPQLSAYKIGKILNRSRTHILKLKTIYSTN